MSNGFGDFFSGLGSGVKGAAQNTWEGLKTTAQGAWDVARDAPGARDQFWATTKGAAQAVQAYGEQAYEDPAMVWRDARDQVGAAWAAGREFAKTADAKQWGEALGEGALTVGAGVTGAGAAAKAAQLAGRGARWAGKAVKSTKRADKTPDTPAAATAPCPKAVAATKARMKLREDLGPEHFDQDGNLRWPPDGGFSDRKPTTLQPGSVIDRYSSDVGAKDRGNYFSPHGTSFGERSLPYDSEKMQYARYRVVKPIDVDAGPAVPAFGQTGGGTQYKTPMSTSDLLRAGFLEPF